MALSLPITEEITAQNVTNFEMRLGQTIPLNSKALVRVLAALEAGLFTSHYRYVANRILQNLALTATGDDLDRIGTNYRVYRKAAVAFVGTITQPAANGTVIPITVDYVSDASGIRYIVNAASSPAAGGYATVSVTAAESGEDGNLAASDTLTIGRQIAGITSTTATYASTTTSGSDRESDDVYRRRILTEIRTVGGGGNAADYRTWAEAVTGVYRVFPFAGAPVAASHKLRDAAMEEIGVAYWSAGVSTLTKETASPYEGLQNLKVAYAGSPNPYAYQIVLEAGRDYSIRLRARGDGTFYPGISDGVNVLWSGTTSTSWQDSGVINFTAAGSELILYAYGSVAGYCEFDAVELTVSDSLPGDRVVYVESTTAVDADGVPPESLLDDVFTALTTDPDTGDDRMPLGATEEKLFVEPIIRSAFDVEVTNLVVDAAKETACKASLDTAVDEYLRSIAPFVEGVDSDIDKNDVITTVSISKVIQEVLELYSASAGGVSFAPAGGAAITSYTTAENETAKLNGSVTYA